MTDPSRSGGAASASASDRPSFMLCSVRSRAVCALLQVSSLQAHLAVQEQKLASVIIYDKQVGYLPQLVTPQSSL